MDNEKKFLTFPKLSTFLTKCNELFARKTIEDKVIGVELSKNPPTGQKVGDFWFQITERE